MGQDSVHRVPGLLPRHPEVPETLSLSSLSSPSSSLSLLLQGSGDAREDGLGGLIGVQGTGGAWNHVTVSARAIDSIAKRTTTYMMQV